MLISRVTDPRASAQSVVGWWRARAAAWTHMVLYIAGQGNFACVGVPPVDLIEDVALAWREAGLDPVECMRKCASVTMEFTYDEQEERVRNRLRPRVVNNRTFPVRNRALAEVLDPQPRCSAVLHRLLEWIDRCDYASQRGEPRPPCRQEDGTPIIPTDDDDLWWRRS